MSAPVRCPPGAPRRRPRAKPRLAIAAVAAWAAAACATPARASTPEELFDSGNSAYEQGRFEDAAKAYETILGYGVRDPRVLYNLGNANFKLDRLGPAILSYERAVRLDPSDRDARDNLELARSRIRDRVPEADLPYPAAVLRSLLDAWSVNALAAVFLAAYLAAAGLVAGVLVQREPLRRRLCAYAAACAALAALLVGSGLLVRVADVRADHAIVMKDKIDALSGPAADNTVLFSVHEGTRLDVRNRRGDWLQVTLPNGLSGWVRADGVEEV